MEKVEEGYKLLRSSKIFAHRAMENSNFSLVQVCSNYRILSQYYVFPFIEKMDYIGYSND